MEWLWLVVSILLISFGLTVLRGAPYVPSLKSSLRQVFDELYILSSKDVVVDIGSGDGVVLREVSRRGARAVGYEINPFLVTLSRLLSFNDSRVRIHLADFWIKNLPDDTTTVYVFSVTRDIKKIEKRLQQQTNRIGGAIKVISFGFDFIDREAERKSGAYYLYVFIPTKN